MIRLIAVVLAVLMLASLGLAGTAMAQAKPDPAQPRMDKMEKKSDTMGQTVEGTIKSVRGNMVTLEDGTQLSIPSSVKVTGQLKPGAQISAEYEERAGQKIAKSVQVKG